MTVTFETGILINETDTNVTYNDKKIKERAEMKRDNKIYITAAELAEMLGVSLGTSYRIIRSLNQELKKEGYIVIAGKIPAAYLARRYFGYGA